MTSTKSQSHHHYRFTPMFRAVSIIFLSLGALIWYKLGLKIGGQMRINDAAHNRSSVAVVTLVTTASYVPGAEVLAESLKRVNAIGDRVLMYVPPEIDGRSDITSEHLRDLELAGWNKLMPLTHGNGKFSKCKGAEMTVNMGELSALARYWGTCSKLALWSLVEYDKVIYIDADSIVLKNIDHLYEIIQQSKGIDFAAQQSPNCPAEPNKVQSVTQSCRYQTAFLVLKPYQHIFDFLKNRMDDAINVLEGELTFLNSVVDKYYALPMWTSIAQTNGVRPWVDNMQEEVDWGQVTSYDFTGPSKPWTIYALQKLTGDPYIHPQYGIIQKDNIIARTGMYPQTIWNEYYEAVLERKNNSNTFLTDPIYWGLIQTKLSEMARLFLMKCARWLQANDEEIEL